MPALQSGRTLASRFTLIRNLGRGGMGDVWLALDRELGAEVVTKIVAFQTTTETVSLLRQECRNARRLSHPNIVRVFDFHQEPDVSFLTMEFVDGGDIGRLRGAPLQQIVLTLLPLIDALAYAHQEGVVHRDLKCRNVLIDAAGQPRLTDFGIAGVLDPGLEDLQLSGGGSRHHTSPQQLAGDSPRPADDVFGLGAMFFELLSGSPPEGGDRDQLAARSCHPISRELVALVRSMLAPRVEDRPPTMEAIRVALQEMGTTGVDEGTMPPKITKADIRLSPPPKVPAVRTSEPLAPGTLEVHREESSIRQPHRWLTLTAFAVLMVVVFAVFVLLPRWVDEKDAKQVAVSGSKPEATGIVEADVDLETSEMAAAIPVAEPEFSDERGPEPLGVEKSSPPPERRSSIEAPAASSSPPPKLDTIPKRFTESMSSGLKAFEKGDYERAKRAFEEALGLDPGSAEAADGLAHTQEELRLVAIAERREQGAVFESEERWQEASGEYEAALALDPTLRFAAEGRARARARADLDEILKFHIEHPERLAEDKVLAEAREALTEGLAAQPVTPRLEEQLTQLERSIQVATTPVRVVLVSDNATEVVVYRVGRLGKFDRKPLELRPGLYTVVGSRSGYRDVRHQLEVVSGGDEHTLIVRCEEEI